MPQNFLLNTTKKNEQQSGLLEYLEAKEKENQGMPKSQFHIEIPQTCPLCHLHRPLKAPLICPHLQAHLHIKYALEKTRATSTPLLNQPVLPNISGLHLQAQSQQTSSFFVAEDIPHSQTPYYKIGTNPIGDQECMEEDGGDRHSNAASSIAGSNLEHPGFPWVKAVEGYSNIDIPGDDHQFHPAKYVRFGLMEGELTIWGTDGGAGEVTQYAEPLVAKKSDIPSGTFVNNTDLQCFDLDQLFARGDL